MDKRFKPSKQISGCRPRELTLSTSAFQAEMVTMIPGQSSNYDNIDI